MFEKREFHVPSSDGVHNLSGVVYLPKGEVWTECYTGKKYEGGQTVTAAAPIDIIPVFTRGTKEYKIY